MRILITGATGFVGRHLAHALSGHEIHAVVRPGSEIGDIATVPWDMVEPMPPNLPDRVDCVVILTQSSRYRDFPDGSADMVSVNVSATMQMADYARKAGAGALIFASTGSVYEPFDGTLTEDCAGKPDVFYATTKLAAEIMLRPYRQFFDVAIMRLFYVYGPGQTDRLIPNLIEKVAMGMPIVMAEEGPVITPTYIDDTVRVFKSAIEEKWAGIFNVAHPQAYSLRDIVTMIGRLLDRPANVVSEEGTPPVIQPDLRRLSGHVSLEDFSSLESGLSKTIDAWLSASR